MLRRIRVPILAVIDLLLLAVILTSSGPSGVKTPDTGSTQPQITEAAADASPGENPSPADYAEALPPAVPSAEEMSPPAQADTVPEQAPQEQAPADQMPQGQPAADQEPQEQMPQEQEPAEQMPQGQPAADQEPQEQEPAEQAPAEITSRPADAGVPSEPSVDISAFDTSERPTLEDFTWITPEILKGICPEGSEDMIFPEAMGGWKCYILDKGGIERFANMEFAGTEEELRLIFDWYYIYVGSEGEGYDDNTPDSVFEGSLVGNVEAYGAGKVTLTDFFRMDDHQYAFGSMRWPDGAVGRLMLVRP